MLQATALSFDYPRTLGVSSVNLQLPPGQVVGILGENGAGKSTLLKLLAGILQPASGQVRYCDQPIGGLQYQDIAYISEELGLFVEWSLLEHRDFYASAFDRFDLERFDKLVAFFRLEPNKKVKTFSKGQKTKLELAIGFCKGARYLLLDEPFLGNDLLTRTDFLKMMAGLMQPDETIVIATHLLNEMEQFLDRAIFLRCGQIKCDYTAEELEEHGGILTVAKEIFRYDPHRIDDIF